MRRWLVLGLLAAVAGVLVAVSDTGMEETLVTIEKGDLVVSIPTEGELEALVSQQVTPPQVERLWNFQISMMAPEGAPVTAGQAVLAFDDTELKQQLQQAMAEVAASEKELEKFVSDMAVVKQQLELRLAEARARLRRAELKAGSDRQVTADVELRKAAIEVDLAQQEISLLEEALSQQGTREWFELQNLTGRVELSRSRVTRLQESIGRMTVTASRPGTVIYRSNWRGEKKQVGEQAWRAEVILEIPDLSALGAMAQVDEAHAGRLRRGLRVTFRLDAYPDTEYSGSIESIRRAVQRKSFDEPGKVVGLRMNLDRTDVERMRPGMRFHGSIVTDVVPEVLLVPAEAIFSDADGSFVRRASRVGQRKVYPEFGRRNLDYVEVVSGLGAGDRVVARAEGGGA